MSDPTSVKFVLQYSPQSAVDVGTRIWAGRSDVRILTGTSNFVFSKSSGPAQRNTQHLVNVYLYSSLWLKHQRHVKHSLRSRTKDVEWAAPQLCFLCTPSLGRPGELSVSVHTLHVASGTWDSVLGNRRAIAVTAPTLGHCSAAISKRDHVTCMITFGFASSVIQILVRQYFRNELVRVFTLCIVV
jgi:hypothetical protein